MRLYATIGAGREVCCPESAVGPEVAIYRSARLGVRKESLTWIWRGTHWNPQGQVGNPKDKLYSFSVSYKLQPWSPSRPRGDACALHRGDVYTLGSRLRETNEGNPSVLESFWRSCRSRISPVSRRVASWSATIYKSCHNAWHYIYPQKNNDHSSISTF